MRFEIGYQKLNYSKINNSQQFAGKDVGTAQFTSFGNNYNFVETITENYQISNSYKITSDQISLDFKPKIFSKQNLEFFGILGMDYQRLKIKTSSTTHGSYVDHSLTYTNGVLTHDISDTGSKNSSSSASKTANFIAPSIGFGGRYEITKDFFLRTQLRYTYLNKTILSTKLKSTTGISLGLGYNF